MPIIDFKATMCKHCYKCVRGCEVKSIMIRDGHAYIMPNRCILCGQCLLNCPQSAKRVPSELSKVKKLIESGAPVIASLSSSYMGVLPYKKRGQVKSALKKLGFTNVCDAAEGAALATEEYVRLLEQGEMKNIITTACPSIVNLIEIHYPELIKYLAPVLIPSGIHTRMLHAEFGEAAKVVVIGPCIAEKEKNRVVKPDAVLTFEDLKQWLSEEQIEIEACEEEPFEDREPGANLRYPVSGGLLTAVTATQKKPDKYRKFYVSGVKDCLDVCEAMKTGEVAGCFIEMNACHGGCVNGPSTATSVSSFKVKLDLEAMLPKDCAAAICSLAIINAAAPSFTPEALPAVITPLARNGAFNPRNCSSVVSGRKCSSSCFSTQPEQSPQPECLRIALLPYVADCVAQNYLDLLARFLTVQLHSLPFPACCQFQIVEP